MTPRITAKKPMRSAPVPGVAAPVNGIPLHSPSVPISLYREVSAELQTTRSLMESLRTQNQHLTEQNQKLRLEIERVVQSALHLRQVADAHPSVPSPAIAAELERPVEVAPAAPARFSKLPFAKKPPEAIVTEQPVDLPRATQKVRSSEIGGWWLVLVIFLIMVTAFGTGFLIVRPLLPNR